MSRKLATLAFALALTTGCGESHRGEPADDGGAVRDATGDDAGPDRDAAPEDAGRDAAQEPDAEPPIVDDEDGGVGSIPCAQQLEDALDGIPDDLRCAGLYLDVAAKLVNPELRTFTPSTQLWSDGAGKQRWIHLPEGEVIDASEPGEWLFPVGTKLWKEFRANGRRVETRLYQKIREQRWSRATFRWNRTETQALRDFGGDLDEVTLFGKPYHIPTGNECDKCHGGRRDRILGFSEVSLGLPGAKGVTLADLVDEGLLDPPPRRTQLSIGDDGTGLAGPALTWLHINCGISCHNDNENSEAYSSGLRLKLFPFELDGRPPTDFDPIRTAVGAGTKTDRYGEDRIRIVPGSPETSLLFQLLTSRLGGRDQMPPIATQVVDPTHADIVEAWIRKLGE